MIDRDKSRLSLLYPLALLLVVFGVVIYGSRNGIQRASAGMTAFAGGTFEASGVVHVPGTDGVLFVDDDHTDEIFFMRVGADRKQAGPIAAVKLSANIIDLEGITTDGAHFYVVGSQSKPEGGDLTGLARFKFDANNQRAVETQSIAGLKSFLANNVDELRGMHNTAYDDGGINVEGIAWDPNRKRLLLGLRSPVVEGQALVVPLKLRDPQGAFSFDNMEVEGRKAISLPLNRAGIRSIEYDEHGKTFRLITGAGPNSEKMDFKLWDWSGNGEPPTLRETDTFDRRLKPEGITRVKSGAQSFTFIVFDTSGYVAKD
ncbi:MAG TPA: DUF3616 domain-containing protein [Pyrinomonadaceae bacterium]|nr:DUF3616 domain-containing protein [Pyrinomonadaceae bacterium]